MKKNKAIILFLSVGIMVTSCFSASKTSGENQKKSAIDQLTEYLQTEETTETVNESTVEASQTEKSLEPAEAVDTKENSGKESASTESQKTFICGKEKITVKYTSDTDKINIIDASGKVYQLDSSTAASGSLYKNADGMSIHLKGNEGVYKASEKSADVICKAEN